MKESLIIKVLLGVILVMLVYNIFFKSDNSLDTKYYNTVVKKQENIIDSLKKVSVQNKKLLRNLNVKLSRVDKNLNSTRKQIKKLEDETVKEISDIKYYSVRELEQFFTERYRERLRNSSD